MGTARHAGGLIRRDILTWGGSAAVLLASGTLSTLHPVLAQGTAPAKRGGSLVHAFTTSIDTMDPHLSGRWDHSFYESVYTGLVRLQLVDAATGQHRVIGALAESWEQRDNKTIVFKLRPGVKFHDGSDLNADVVKWNFLRQKEHPKSQLKSGLAFLESVDVLDKSTVRIRSKADNAALLRSLAFTSAALVRMVSKESVDKLGEDGFARRGVGTGPFRVKQWVTDDRVIMERHPDYFEQGDDGRSLPYLNELVMRVIPDPTVSLVDMRAGTVHVVEAAAPKDIAGIKADPNLGVVEMPWIGVVLFLVGYNLTKPPFNDLRVRQAANYGIDRQGLAQAMGFGAATPHYYPYYTPATPGFDPTVEKYEYNPAKAKQLLAEAGHPNGISIELKVIAREPEATIAEFVQPMWTASGINTRLVKLTRSAWGDALKANNFEATFWRGQLWGAVEPEFARPMLGCNGASNWSFFCDPDVDRALDQGLATLDPKKRDEIYRTMWGTLHRKAYVSSGYLVPAFNAYRKEVQGLAFNFQPVDFRRAWLNK